MPHPAFAWWRRATVRIGLIALLAIAGAGCTGLPQNVARPVSTALQAPASTSLGALVARKQAASGSRHPSGFMLLAGPQAAYGSRLALVEAAEKTLDLQYYAIHADASTERLLLGIIAAAQRGVRVRVLLDDFHSTGRDAQVMRLAFEPNIEMRMFNPLTGARGSTLGRMFSLVTDFSRVQQRMHNKLFIADNAMGVTGGRNLGDAYFGNAESGNFVDLDVLAVGPVVRDLSASFDSYWNNERAYPVQSLITREELDLMRERYRAADTEHQSPTNGQGDAPGPGDDPTATGAPPTAAQRARVWNRQPMDLAQAAFVWAAAAVMVDQPTKIPADVPTGNGTATGAPTGTDAPSADPAADRPLAGDTGIPATAAAPAASAPARPASTTTNGPPVPGPGASMAAAGASASAVAATVSNGDTVVDGLLGLMGQARSDVLIISPYFVPGADMKAAFSAARQRGVRVRVLTNSLASNDAPIAHAGYARHRPDLVAMGVELHELRSEQAAPRTALSGSGSGSAPGGSGGTGSGLGSSRSMLHTKLMVVDGRLLVIGSMNLDLRSQRHNTELALLIRSSELSRRVITRAERALLESSWRVEAHPDGPGLVWRAPAGSDLEDQTTEPGASAGLRFMLLMLGPLAPDELL